MINYPSPPHIVFGEVVDAVRTEMLATIQAYDPTVQTIRYEYCNMVELQKIVKDAQANLTERKKIFPMIVYVLDVAIDRGTGNSPMYGQIPNATILILNHTKHTYSSKEREQKNFTPILRPLYYTVLKQMARHAGFNVQSERKIPHRVIDHFFWGQDANTVNAIAAYVDAIEITDLQLDLNWHYCNTPITVY